MRYLRKYNESTTISHEIEESCKDILIDLEDEGFDTKIEISGAYNQLSRKTKSNIKIVITSGKSGKSIDELRFKYSEISDVVYRLSSYLESEGYSLLNVYGERRKRNSPDLISVVGSTKETDQLHSRRIKYEESDDLPDRIKNSSAIEYTIRFFEI